MARAAHPNQDQAEKSHAKTGQIPEGMIYRAYNTPHYEWADTLDDVGDSKDGVEEETVTSTAETATGKGTGDGASTVNVGGSGPTNVTPTLIIPSR